MAAPRCPSCTAGLTVAELTGTHCPYCQKAFAEDLAAITPPPGAPPPPVGPPGRYAHPIYPTPYAAFNLNALTPPSSTPNPERGGFALMMGVVFAVLVAIGVGAYFLMRR
jgi:hypothetical protein